MTPYPDSIKPASPDFPDVWLGVKKCGCVCAVCKDDPQYPHDTEESKLDFLKQGLQVVFATGSEWQSKYLDVFLADCPHGE